jgi:hypothetical protein
MASETGPRGAQKRSRPQPQQHDKRAAPRGSNFTTPITHEIACLGGRRSVCITYTNEVETIDAWCATAISSGVSVFGLDCEHPPNFRPGGTTEITVLQIAYNDQVLVVQLNAIASPSGTGSRSRANVRSAANLTALFSRPETAFAGMGVSHDVSEAAELLGVARTAVPACIDLKAMSMRACCETPGGLGGLAQAVLGVEKWKSKKLALSRWGEWPLEGRRVVYAAMDAWASWALFAHLEGLLAPAAGAATTIGPASAAAVARG